MVKGLVGVASSIALLAVRRSGTIPVTHAQPDAVTQGDVPGAWAGTASR